MGVFHNDLQTGSILFEGKHLTHWDYCLNPVPSEDDQSEQLVLKALVCLDSELPVALTGKHNEKKLKTNLNSI